MELFAESHTEKIYIRKDSIFYETLLKNKDNSSTHNLKGETPTMTMQVNDN